MSCGSAGPTPGIRARIAPHCTRGTRGCILPIGMTVAWKSEPIGCQGSDPDVNQADALHIKVGSTDFPRC